MTEAAATAITEPALLVHAYVAVGADAASWREPLQRLWDAFCGLGRVEPLPNLPCDRSVPATLPASGSYSVLMGGALADRPGTHEAVLYRYQGAAGLSAMLYEGTLTWSELESYGAALAAGTLGADLVYLGISQASLNGQRIVPALAAQLGQTGGRPGPAYRASGGLQAAALPDLPAAGLPQAGRPPTRRLVVLAPRSQERAMYEWAWAKDGQPVLRPLARFLFHAAVVRWAEWRLGTDSQFRDSAELASRAADDLIALMERATDAGDDRVSVEQLLRAEVRLSRAASKTAGLATAVRDLRLMHLAVRLSADAMRGALAADRQPGPATFAWRDLELADRLAGQLAADAEYLTATHDNVAEVSQTAKALVDERLGARGQRLVVLQTAVIGAILMGLTAAVTLGYHAPVPRRSQLPLIAVLVAIALALPPAAQRFTDPDRRPMRLALPGYGLLAACGAAVGWFAFSLATYAAGWPPAAPLPALGAAAGGAAAVMLGGAITVRAAGRGRPR